jgi:Chaperone of endosialidase
MKNLHPRTNVTCLLAAAFLALATTTFAVDPPPGGGYPGQNTALGDNALFSLVPGSQGANTALGFIALYANTIGNGNNATGTYAMMTNTTGSLNVADGYGALEYNTTGSNNTAVGRSALGRNSTGNTNTGVGAVALYANTVGHSNTAVGFAALGNTFYTASNNIAIGANAGNLVENGNDNIEIGNDGALNDSGMIRIGNKRQTKTFISGINGVTVAGGVGVIINTQGQLGTVVSSARYKDAIKPMDKASEAILSLQPVTFHYKHELDPAGIPQFGLVAEQVAKVDPDLVARDDQGKPYTVRYEAVNAMLLNEFLKEHRRVEEQSNWIAQQDRKVEEQNRKEQELEATVSQLQSALKAQAAQIQMVSDQLRTHVSPPRLVAND